jgi:hypothetical protein
VARVPYATIGKGGPAKQYLVLPPSVALACKLQGPHHKTLSNFSLFFTDLTSFTSNGRGNDLNVAKVYAKMHNPWSET